MKARAAVRDAGRVLGYPYGVPDKITKQMLNDTNATIEDSLKANAELRSEYEDGGDTKRILDAALALEGVVRGEGVHAAAVVICRDPLAQHTPLKLDTKGEAIVTQYEGTVIADLGLLKMDFLGLRTLTVIAKACKAIKANHGVDIDLEKLPTDDAKTFALLQRGDTDAVFQVESPGMKNTLKQLKPTTFGDIVAVVALFRPGPMEKIPEYVARKHGQRPVTYYDDRLKPFLEETHGLLVYQEQVMRIAMAMSGFSGAKADKLRKGMGKKDADIMKALKPEFIEGAVANGYDRRMVEGMWGDIEKFGEYAFNKSHAAAYAILAYQTAYLKAHYPIEYMAANLTSYLGKTDTIVKYVAACNRAGIQVLPPDVNSSGKDFTAVGDTIRFGLAGIRGVGEGVVETIIAAREDGGPFTSLADFCERVDMRQCNKRTLEALIKAGAFDSTGYTRKHLMSLIDTCVEAAATKQRDRASGQVTMFDLFADDDSAESNGFADNVAPPNNDEWDRKMKLAFEKDMLGIYVSDHPLREIADDIRAASTASTADVGDLRDGTFGCFAGIIAGIERRPTKSGNLMASATLEDLGRIDRGDVLPEGLRALSRPDRRGRGRRAQSARGELRQRREVAGAGGGTARRTGDRPRRGANARTRRHRTSERCPAALPGQGCLGDPRRRHRQDEDVPCRAGGRQGREWPARRAHRDVWSRRSPRGVGTLVPDHCALSLYCDRVLRAAQQTRSERESMTTTRACSTTARAYETFGQDVAMRPERPVTPRGFRDVMPQEAAERETVSERVREVFDSWGYSPVETPVVELGRVLEMAAGSLENTALRLIDVDGTLLALRPDMTLPVARLIATRLSETPGPLRLRYAAPVFRERASLRGEAREFTQLGVELVGDEGPAADAEVVILAVEALEASGLADFSLGLGTVAVIDAVLERSGQPDDWCVAVRDVIHDRDFVALGSMGSREPRARDVVAALSEILRLRGGRDAIDRCRRVLAGFSAGGVLDDFERTYGLVEGVVRPGRVQVDFGIVRQFDYYTGIVLEAYAAGVGLPLGGGGRYDRALAAFGSPSPAAGFAFSLERLMIALVEQGSVPEVSASDVVLGGAASDVFALAKIPACRGQASRASAWLGRYRTRASRSATRRGIGR